MNKKFKMIWVAICCANWVQTVPARATDANHFSEIQENERNKNNSLVTLPVEGGNIILEVNPDSSEDHARMIETLSSRTNEETSYSFLKEHWLGKHIILKRFPVFEKEWSITFEVNPSRYEDGVRNILDLRFLH